MNEKFDIGKLIRGFNLLNGEHLGKIISIIIIVTACLFAYNFISSIFTSKQNINKPAITAESGSAVTYNVVQNPTAKRRLEIMAGAGVSTGGKPRENRYLLGGGFKW